LERHHLLVEYLQKTTGLPVRQVFPDTFDEHVKMVGRGKIDISFVNPFVYVRMHQLFQAEAFAKVLEYPPGRKQAPSGTLPSPAASFRGQIIVRADNKNIKSLNDCLGKRWIAVDPTSAGGYLYPLGLFHSQGITSSDFSEIAFAPGPGGKQEKVVMAVLAGKYDLGSIREGTLDVITGSADVHNITVLANTTYYPGWVYSARKGLDPNVLEKIRTALLALDPSKPGDLLILDKADFAGIVAATDKDFDQVRELVSTIGPELQ
jgi:phosphonate transport system substrate-binding protein